MVDGRDETEVGAFDNLAEPCPWLAEQSSLLAGVAESISSAPGISAPVRKPAAPGDLSALAQLSDACAEDWGCDRLA